ncbi:MAG: YtpR family tRNA-binding protein, partial [Bacteroidales bacterium]
MKISYNWLKQYLPVEQSPEELEQILINLGLEVESLERWYSVSGGLTNFVIGRVLTCEKHPQADRLHVTTVDVGKPEPLRIVCGAPNVAAGQKVVVALPGAKVFTPKGEFEIQKTKIRGEVSEGMICAEDEMGMGDGHEGILVLDDQAPVGMPASEYFQVADDWVFEIGLTPNRIDSASHFGVARDLAAYLKQFSPVALERPDVSNFKVDSHELPFEVIIENTEACKRYSGIAIKGVTIKESPAWLKNRLAAIGVRPINNVVDVTNYVLHELGQPLHAFDADKIKGRKVIIRTLPAGTPFVTLDGVTRKLSDADLMICNEK